MRDYKLFDKLLDVLKEGMQITFTPNNVAEGDRFLIFSAYKSQKVTLKHCGDLWYVFFEGDEPMRLEDCPDSFYRSIIKNAK